MVKRAKYILSILLSALLVLYSGACSGGGGTPPVSEQTQPVVTEPPVSQEADSGTDAVLAVTEQTELTEVEPPRADSSDVNEDTSDTEVTSETVSETSDETSETTEPAVSSETTLTADTESSQEVSSAAPAETSGSSSAADETTKAVTAAITTTTTTTAAATTAPVTETTAAATTAKAAKPSPPQISEVSSPGKKVFTGDTATFDYSNCNDGYVSVNYTGNTRLKMLLKKGDSQFDYDIYPAKGAQYFTLAQGNGTYTAEVYDMLDNGKFVKLFGEQFDVRISDELKLFTYKNQYVNFSSSSKCVNKASEVCAGCTTNIEKIAAVFGYVTDNVTYDKALAASVTSGYIPDPDKVLAAGKGICFDYASLVAAMLRSQGVPTRLIIGYASPNIYHAWNEVYTPEKGWIAAEIALDGKGFKRIDATFYASASNKQNFADYIAKSGNYSDVYIY